MLKKIFIALIIGITLHNPAFAGKNCGESNLLKEEMVLKASNASQKMIAAANLLSPEGDRVFLIGRIGQNLSEYKLKYSHGAFLVKNNGNWEVFHELNECSSDKSDMFNEGILNFFLDDLYQYNSIIISFNADTNLALKEILNNKSILKQAHNPHYNLLAYPFSSKYQNSNGWLLEILTRAMAKQSNRQINSYEDFISYLKELNYQPDLLNIGMFKRLGGRMFKANVAFDDQPFDDRMAGHIRTVTFDGLFQFLKDRKIVYQSMEIISN